MRTLLLSRPDIALAFIHSLHSRSTAARWCLVGVYIFFNLKLTAPFVRLANDANYSYRRDCASVLAFQHSIT
jgi:hypothetical protein